MGLSHNQERAVTVALRLLEERLRRIERVIDEDEEGILYRRHAEFSTAQRRTMHELIDTMREQIRRAADEFHLQEEEQHPVREIVGTLSLTWESLEESRPRKLNAYGAVDPALNETLEPIMQMLIQLLFRLQAAAEGKDRALVKIESSIRVRDTDHGGTGGV